MGLFTETPWPLIVPCLIAAVGLFVVGSQQRRKGLLIGSGPAIALALTAFVVDHFVVTAKSGSSGTAMPLAIRFIMLK